MKILIIAEKNSVMKKIVHALAKDAKYDKGYAESNDYVFTHCVGHLLSLKMPDEIDPNLKRWDLKNLPFNFTQIPLKISSAVKDQFKVVQSLLKRKDICEVVNACDADREGELIFRNILAYCKPNIPKQSRMWIETTESDAAVKKTFDSRLDGSLYENLYHAAKARQYADYLLGLSSTQGMSVVFGQGHPLTIGRVQTPTLKIIVDREKEIDNFKSQPFYKILAHTKENIDGNYINKELDQNRFTNKIDCENEVKSIGLGEALVEDVLIENKKDTPRLFFNLSDLQIEMNKRYKMSAQTVLDCCQSLYEEHGLTTYPRTPENRISPELASKQAILVDNVPDCLFERQKKEIQSNKWVLNARVIAKKDIASHEALTPVPGKKITKEMIDKLNDYELKVYKAICERFLSNFYPDAIYEKQTITFTRNNRKFENTITNLAFAGHLACYEAFKGGEKGEFVKINKGDTLNISNLEIVEGATVPPGRFTEGTLIKVMISPLKYVQEKADKEILKETEGIGTEATRASIIETLKKQAYIEITKGTIYPTDKGMSLIDVIPSDIIKSVKLTAMAEKKLSLIAKGEYKDSDFLEIINKMDEDFINELRRIKEDMNENGNKQYADFSANKPIGKCPHCGGDIVESKYGFYCKSKCGVSFNFEALKYLRGPKMTKTIVSDLISKGKTKKPLKFTSKAGKPYEAYLLYHFDEGNQYPNQYNIEFKNNK